MGDTTLYGFPGCSRYVQWYRCTSNGFEGCCSVDPCSLQECPDIPRDSQRTITSSPLIPNTTSSSPPPTLAPPAMATTDSLSPAPSPTPSSLPSSSSSSSPSPTSTEASSSSKTDSGVTHTIPNDSTVTVIRHTTVTRGIPATTAEATPDLTAAVSQNSTIAASPPSPPSAESHPGDGAGAGQGSPGINASAIAGIATGSIFAIALAAALIYLWRNRCRRAALEPDNGMEAAFLDKSGLHDNILGRQGPDSASLPRRPTPQQAAANARSHGYDPFAAFGGSVDAPASAVEMDGRGVQVVELPGTALTTPDAVELPIQTRNDTQPAGVVKHRPCTDPRATLNHLPRSNGRPTYINQWNQYRPPGGGRYY